MISLARSSRAKNWAQRSRAATALARRYVAGDTAAQAIAVAKSMLHRDGLRASLFYLGEYVDRPELLEVNVQAKIAIADALAQAGLDVHVSVDPTQIGYLVSPDTMRRNAFAIAEAIARASHGSPGTHALMLDMEDDSVIDATLALHDELRCAGLPAALTLQAYLRRSAADLEKRIAAGTMVRLVKGAFAARSAVAFTDSAQIKENSRRLIDLMFSRDARSAGFRPVVATHDEKLQTYAARRALEAGWRRGLDYELEMLFGVRQDLAKRQAQHGECVRLYVPFGRDWWPHALRRIGENPANAWLLGRSLIG
jgi:proline dehydrogenase